MHVNAAGIAQKLNDIGHETMTNMVNYISIFGQNRKLRVDEGRKPSRQRRRMRTAPHVRTEHSVNTASGSQLPGVGERIELGSDLLLDEF